MNIIIRDTLNKVSQLVNQQNQQLSKKNINTVKSKSKKKSQNINNNNNVLNKQKKLSNQFQTFLDKNKIKAIIIQHPFLTQQLQSQINNIIDIVIKQFHKNFDNSNNNIQNTLDTLSLYFKRQTNNQLFSVLQFILQNPQGISYSQIANHVKLDVINVSHYCCRLKKMKFIGWEHKKDGIIVFPHQTKEKQLVQLQPQDNNYIKNPFCLKQLSILQNVWLNVSNSQTFSNPSGISNEQIKAKVLKHSQNKMIRRAVDLYDKQFQKIAERQGKVYEFKYKNYNQKIKLAIEKQQSNEMLKTQTQILDTVIQQWIKEKFSQYKGQNFFLQLINDHVKQYVSSLGVKNAKRQCTPLKLSRYIKIVNYLNRYGGQTQVQLRRFIVQFQKDLNIGTMHKRSLIGILQGLVKLGLLKLQQDVYYPCWQTTGLKRSSNISCESMKNQLNSKKKKIKLNQSLEKKAKNKKETYGITISYKKHKLQLFATFLQYQLQAILKRIIKKTFNQLKRVPKKKTQVVIFQPQKHIFDILNLSQNNMRRKLPEIQSTCFDQLLQQIDLFVQKQGKIEKSIGQMNIGIDNIKFLRKHPLVKYDYLKQRFGKQWKRKFQSLQIQGKIKFDDEQQIMKTTFQIDQFLV